MKNSSKKKFNSILWASLLLFCNLSLKQNPPVEVTQNDFVSPNEIKTWITTKLSGLQKRLKIN